MHAHRLRAGHLAHDVHVVDPAIDDRRQRVHQVAVPVPGRPPALLIEVHAHDQRLAEGAGALDELLPGWVHAQDVADDQLLAGLARLVHHRLGAVHGGGERLFDEDVGAGVEGLEAELLVGVRVGVDRDRVGAALGQRLVDVLVARQRRELGGQVVAPADSPAAQPDELEAIDLLVSECVAEPHVADAHHEHSHCSVLHDRLPFSDRPPGGARLPPMLFLLVAHCAAACRPDQTAGGPLRR